MKYYVMTVRDSVSDVHSLPVCVPNMQGYLRAFGDEVNRADDNNSLYKHPEDYEVLHLGEFDDETATFKLLDRPVQVAMARQFVKGGVN